MFRKSALLFALAMRMSGSAETVDREETRLAALRAIFPGMTIVRTEKRIDKSWRPDLPKPVLSFADGLRDEAVYRVSGPAANEVERCASENMETEKFSETRLVRFRMFRWPVERVHAAVVQYDFEGANPAGSCWSIALVVSLALQGESMRVADRRLLDPMHHSSIQSVRVVEVSGDGMDDLLVESDSGGAGDSGERPSPVQFAQCTIGRTG